GAPSDWLDDSIHFPEFTGIGGESTRAAIYNRLPPNAERTFSAAYRSNYDVSDNYEASLLFPQGHGDAFGYYLTATKAYLELLAAPPRASSSFDERGGLLHALSNDDEMLG